MNPDRWQQIKQLYNAALDLESDRRAAFLHGACADDASLRTEIERLLAHRAEAEDVLGRPAIEAAAELLAQDQLLASPEDLVGHTVSHFRIVEKIGAGGMGVVCRAWDERLGRDTAVKFLPEIFVADRERLARLEREARLLASVSHPNIAAIYGLEVAGDKRFLVMEYVDGETLAQKLARGPLPLEETLEICRQIAEGVEAAHEKGIVHRDLKPANVKITPDGAVKLLDFGLAKGLWGEISPAGRPPSPATPDEGTRPGVILGTAAYMSPEQAKGRPLDRRADIWAFGCIVYECLTGRRPFQGDSAAETLAAVLTGEPDWTLLPREATPQVRSVLQRCLQKDLKLRYRDIADACLDLEGMVTPPPEPGSVLRRPARSWLAAGAALAFAAGAFAGLLLARYARPAPPAHVVMSTIKVEPGHWLDGGRAATELERPSRTAMAVSRDGSFLVYSAIEENPGSQARPQLYLRRMDQPRARPIAGTRGGINPFLSPDDRWVGFWADGKLQKIPVEGGVPTTLCDTSPWLYGAHWGGDNSIVFADGWWSGLSTISAEGGRPEILTTPDSQREEASHRLPHWLPDGKAVLFTVLRYYHDSQPSIAVLRLDNREWRVLLPDGADARYVPTGHLVFVRQGTIMAVRFDLATLQVVGQPAPIVENVLQSFSQYGMYHTSAGQFGLSDTGSLVYAPGGIVPPAMNSLVWVDQKGKAQQVTALKFPFAAPRLSPSGDRIAYLTPGREWPVWIYDIGRGTNSQLTHQGRASFPIWSPDGRRLLFPWQRSLVVNLYWQSADGSAPMERVTSGQFNQFPGSWSSDGKTVALVEQRQATGSDIALLDTGTRRVVPFSNSPSFEGYPEFSPDGRWLAYVSDESGARREVYVRPASGSGVRQQVSSEGGVEPLWAKNGRQLFYRWHDQVWAVDVRTDNGFTAARPRVLFEQPGYEGGEPFSGPIRHYDLSLDGQRFLMVKLDDRRPTPVTEMILVENWFKELERLVPSRK